MLTPYYSEDGVTIYHGDCRLVIPQLVGVDAVITDPPYGISHSSSHGASWQNTEIAGDHSTEVRDWVWKYYADAPRAMFGVSWKKQPPSDVRGVLIWDKGPAFGMGDLRFPWKPSWEEIYIAGDGWQGRRDEGVLRGPCVVSWESKGRFHPHQKPEWLLARLIEKLPNSKLILDPFAGSGTTLLTAKGLRRQAVGIEVEERYCEIAATRMQQGVLQLA